MNNRETGAKWEDVAVKYVEAHGMRVVERNFRIRQGEVDIIGYHCGYLVFAEVKFRKDSASGYAVEAVNLHKQKQICKVANYYRYLHRLGDLVPVRYDVIAIQGEEVEWIQNAFPHIL